MPTEGATYGDTPHTLTLDSPGAAPRRVVAYSATQKAGEHTVTVTMGTKARDGQQINSIAFTTKLAWEVATGAPQRPARARFDFRFRDLVPARDPSMSDDEWNIVRAIYDGFLHVTGRIYAAPSGDAVIAQVDGLPTQPSWLTLLHVAIVPFPSEPIGRGARWTTELTDPYGPTVRRTYELVSIAGDVIVVKLTGEAQETPNPARASVGIPAMRATITGDATVDLRAPLPRSVSIVQAIDVSGSPDDTGPTARLTW